VERGLLGWSGFLPHADQKRNNKHHNQRRNCHDRYSLARVSVAYNHAFDLNAGCSMTKVPGRNRKKNRSET
jgi:hypothetical protein